VAATCEAVGVGPGGTVGIALGTINGGTTWTAQSIPSKISSLFGIACASAKICEAVGQTGSFPNPNQPSVIGTTNGGTAWTIQSIPSVGASLNGVACVAAGTCWAGGANTAGSGLVLVRH
jgi:photosystem II stability/assembly factor-like uncharacterized protein